MSPLRPPTSRVGDTHPQSPMLVWGTPRASLVLGRGTTTHPCPRADGGQLPPSSSLRWVKSEAVDAPGRRGRQLAGSSACTNPHGTPAGGPFPTPHKLPGLRQENKNSNLLPKLENKQIKEPQTQRQQNQQAARRRLRPPRTPKQPRPGVPCLPSRGDGHSPPPWDKPELLVGLAELPPRLLTLLGSAGRASRASSWTLGSRHERQPRS